MVVLVLLVLAVNKVIQELAGLKAQQALLVMMESKEAQVQLGLVGQRAPRGTQGLLVIRVIQEQQVFKVSLEQLERVVNKEQQVRLEIQELLELLD